MFQGSTHHATVLQEAFRLDYGHACKPEDRPFTKDGVVPDRIERIDGDAAEDERMGLVHPARVRLNRAHTTVDGVRRALASGLATTAEIKTGRRRIIEFLLRPLSRRVQEAGRER